MPRIHRTRGNYWLRFICCVGLITAGLSMEATAAWAHGGRPIPPPDEDPFAEPDPPPPPPPEQVPPATPPPAPVPAPPPEDPAPPMTPPTEAPPDEPPPPAETPPPAGTPPASPGGPRTPPRTNPPPQTNPPRSPPVLPGRRARGKTAAQSKTWLTWWRLNRWSVLPDRDEIARRRTGVVTGPARDVAQAAHSERVRVAKAWIVPFLLEQLDPHAVVDDEVRASAAIALTKVANDSGTISLVLSWARERAASSMVRESAALALGLLRRTETTRQVAPMALAHVRSALLTLFDDAHTPWRPRTFAMLALGLLGDQPFQEGIHQNGVMLSRALWLRLGRGKHHREETTAILTALGMQPAAGVPSTVKDSLRQIVMGKRALRRSWPALERSHALTTVVRLNAPGWPVWMMRVLASRRAPHPVRRAAWIALGAHAASLTSAERLAIAHMWKRAERNTREMMGKGLMRLAQGQLLSADLAAGRTDLLQDTTLGRDLLRHAAGEQVDIRTFAMLGLGIAARSAATADGELADKFAADARTALGVHFVKRKGGGDPTAAAAVALGLVGPNPDTAAVMRARLADHNAPEQERAACAVALAQQPFGGAGPGAASLRGALVAALWDRRMPTLRQEAALALSFLARKDESRTLLREFSDAGTSQWVLGQVAGAIGRLSDVRIIPNLIAIAKDKRNGDHARGLAIASLGLLADPEPRASLFRLTMNSNFPARTVALDEAFSIL